MISKSICAFCASVFAVSSFGQATLKGIVLGPGGKPVPTVNVLYGQQPTASSSGTALLQGFVSSDNSGNFAISGLPGGTYQLCLDGSSKDFLDPCMWSAKTLVTVPSGGVAAGIQVKFLQASVLKLRLDDPAHHLTGRENKGPGTELILAARAPSGLVQSPHLVSTDGNGRNYEVLIPSGTQVNVALLTEMFDLADDNGKAVGGPNGDLHVTIPPGQASLAVTVHVVGNH